MQSDSKLNPTDNGSDVGGAPLLRISTRSLWGYDTATLSLQNPQDRQTIIARVFDAGTHEDKLAVIAYFDLEAIRQALLNTAELQASTISLTAIWLDLKPEQYRAFRRQETAPLKFASF